MTLNAYLAGIGIIAALMFAIIYVMQKRNGAAQPSERLTPGDCECGHMRSSHEKGKGKCHGEWPPDDSAVREAYKRGQQSMIRKER